MLLEKLIEYSERLDLPPSLYAEGPVRYWINLDAQGQFLPPLVDTDWIVVHDGARPFVTSQVIERGLAEATCTGAAVAAVKVKDTVKVVDADMTVLETPDRQHLWLVQTPQVFSRELLTRAHSEVAQDVTDDASMVERVGGSVWIFQGSYANIKVTTPEDLEIAEYLLSRGTAGEDARSDGTAVA